MPELREVREEDFSAVVHDVNGWYADPGNRDHLCLDMPYPLRERILRWMNVRKFIMGYLSEHAFFAVNRQGRVAFLIVDPSLNRNRWRRAFLEITIIVAEKCLEHGITKLVGLVNMEREDPIEFWESLETVEIQPLSTEEEESSEQDKARVVAPDLSRALEELKGRR